MAGPAGAASRIVDLEPTGVQPQLPDGNGKPLYHESHALLISVSAYVGAEHRGFSRLDNTGPELDRLATVLRQQGFHVRRVHDPDSRDLPDAYKKFAAEFGHDPENRLLLLYSGHGYTDKASDVGYLVPVDAPDPRLDARGFYSRAMLVQDIYTLAEAMSAKHQLFMFDSCFSGTIFLRRGGTDTPSAEPAKRQQYFLSTARQPIRQFITAGRAEEPVPARSVFLPLFIQALQGRAANWPDGFLTGKDLGHWLEEQVPEANPAQHPQSGVVREPELNMGDMVFQITPALTAASRPEPAAPSIAAADPGRGTVAPTAVPAPAATRTHPPAPGSALPTLPALLEAPLDGSPDGERVSIGPVSFAVPMGWAHRDQKGSVTMTPGFATGSSNCQIIVVASRAGEGDPVPAAMELYAKSLAPKFGAFDLEHAVWSEGIAGEGWPYTDLYAWAGPPANGNAAHVLLATSAGQVFAAYGFTAAKDPKCLGGPDHPVWLLLLHSLRFPGPGPDPDGLRRTLLGKWHVVNSGGTSDYGFFADGRYERTGTAPDSGVPLIVQDGRYALVGDHLTLQLAHGTEKGHQHITHLVSVVQRIDPATPGQAQYLYRFIAKSDALWPWGTGIYSVQTPKARQ